MRNPLIWLVIVLNLAILAVTPFLPEGNWRWAPFAVALIIDVVLYIISHKPDSPNDKAAPPRTYMLAWPVVMLFGLALSPLTTALLTLAIVMLRGVTFWDAVHNVLAHPLMTLSGNARWADQFHDWTADKAWPSSGNYERPDMFVYSRGAEYESHGHE